MRPQVRIEGDAERELDEAIFWYERQQPGLGQEFLHEFGATIDRIRERPTAFPLARGVPQKHEARSATLKRFPFSVAFVAGDVEIRVFAVAHAKRRPGYWVRRS